MPHIDLDNPSEGHKQVQGVNQIEINGTWRVATKEEVEDAGALIYPAVMSPTDLLLEIFGGGDEDSKKAPDGWFTTQAAAAIAAETSNLYQPYWGETPQGGMETVYPYDIIRNGLYFTHVSKNVAATADKRFSLAVSPEDGNTYAIDMANPTKPKTKADIVFEAANVPDPGAVPINEKPIPLGNGKFMTFYAVTDAAGNTTRQSVVSEKERGAPTSDDIIKFSEAQGGGRLIPLGDGRYTYEPEPDAPFQASPSDVVALPSQGGSLIKTSENQYQFVRDTFDPGRKVDATGREYLQQIDGRWTELAPRFEPELIRADGMNLFQQRSGDITQLSTATMDDLINQALIDGDVDKALAFQDFRDRPTAQEAFNTALEFARSPADQRIISAIARGITPVQPPPEGTIQRVGPQPDFLVQAYEDFQRRTQAGRAPTGEEISAATEDPTLQARLESIANKDRREEEKHQLFITTQTNSERRAQEEFDAEQRRKDTKAAVSNGGVKGEVKGEVNGEVNGGSTEVDAGDAGDAGGVTSAEIQTVLPGTRVKQEGTTTMVNNKGEVANIADTLVDQFKSGENPAGWRVISEKELQDADEAAAVEADRIATVKAEADRKAEADLQAYGKKRAQELRDALAAGFNPADYHNIGGRAIEAHQESLALEEEQRQEDIREEARSDISKALEIAGVGNSPGVGMPTSPSITELKGVPLATPQTETLPAAIAGYPAGATWADIEAQVLAGVGNPTKRAGGGTVQPGEITVVGEQGPEIAMMPPGTHILPLGKATKRDIKAAQATGRAYQQGGIVFGDLAPGLQQLQRGRPITPPRGYLFQQGGLTLPSMQALQNLTPTVRESFYGMHGDIGISPADFRQELQTAAPGGTRLPTSRMLPLGRRGVR